MSDRGTAAPAPIPLDRSLPRGCYVEEAAYEAEAEAVLMSDWFCVGREESLSAPGEYLTVDVAGESVVVVRSAEGDVRAHFNLCRHRGSRLVPAMRCAATDAGPTGCFGARIRCPYHAWTYGLDGRLQAAPFLRELREHRDELSLHEVEAATWGGFVFVRLEAPDPNQRIGLAETLGEIPERLASYDLAQLRIGRRLTYEVAANWKVLLENYNECYHCGPVHPELCEVVPAFAKGGAGLDWGAGIPHRDGAYSFTFTGTTARASLPGLTKEEAGLHKGELILPNLMISCSADHVAAFTLWPRSAGRTSITCDFLFHPSELEKATFDPSDAVEFWDLVNRQDWSICEQVQDGMGSRRFSFGYLAPMEQPSADVGRHIRKRLGALEAGGPLAPEAGRPLALEAGGPSKDRDLRRDDENNRQLEDQT
ncbi:MAG: aromatic ring-hydroxylating oxygenase subunit alpha [Acidimicrobiales bacterium]